jgi:nucleoside-diphosphate-sugar epimerase
MRLFVTGGTGFIGTHVVHQLVHDKHELLLLCLEGESIPSALNSKSIHHIIRGNLGDIETWKQELEQFRPQVTVHMAWAGIPNYDSRTSTMNLIHGLKLITMLAEIGCEKVLCTGSCWEYGQKSGALREDSIVRPSNVFTAAKHSLHLMGREIALEKNMKFIWTRLFYVYGPGQKGHSLIPHIITAIQSGKKPNIKTPHSRNDFVYVEDVATAISTLISKNPNQVVYNIGSGYSTEILDIINMVYRFYGHKEKCVLSNNEPSNAASVDFWADLTRIKEDVGWEPAFSIEEGIKKTIESYKKIL